MGFEGAKPFCESLSTFFSEESRGPSRPERQVKRDLRGKSQAEKGKRQKKKRAHKRMAGRQRQRRPDQAQKYQTTHKPGTRQRHTGRKKPGHRAQKPSQQRQAAQERPARHMARHIGRRKTPPNRQNSRSLFCLPGGALWNGAAKKSLRCFWLARSFFAARFYLLRIAPHAALQKGGAAPFYPLQAF